MALDAYRLRRTIARGGMGEIVLAEDASGKQVVIKRIASEHRADPRFVRMLLDEAHITMRLEHPGIVRVLEAGIEGDVPYLVMEHVDGSDLHDLADRARSRGLTMQMPAVIELGRALARALEHAHGARDAAGALLALVHRDVTPSNVLVSFRGEVLLTDFGIARARGRLEQTSLGTTKGKRGYMPPEQTIGAELDARADVFALACVLVFALTGRSPIADESVHAALIAGEPVTLDPRVEPPLRDVLARALSPARHSRFRSAGAFADALDSIAMRDGGAALRAWASALRDEASLVAQREAPTVGRARPRRYGVMLAVAAPALLLLALAARSVAPSSSRVTSATGTSGSTPSSPGPPPIAPQPIALPSVAPPPSPPLTSSAESDATPLAARAPDRPRPTAHAREIEPPPPVSPVTAVSPGDTGWLAVGGAGAAHAFVFVDGERRDFAPLRISLPVGAHRVALRRPDGTLVDERVVDVRADHTPSEPMRWVVP